MSKTGFYSEFLRTLFWRPGQALNALYWHVTGRRVRARNRLRIGAQQSPFAYSLWIDKVEALDRAVDATVPLAGWLPRYSVIADPVTVSDSAALGRLRRSLLDQRYPDWELLLPLMDTAGEFATNDPRIRTFAGSTDVAENFARAIAVATGDYLIPLGAGTIPSPAIFCRYTEALQIHRKACVLYADHDRVDDRGFRKEPWFKPRWNRELFLAQDYISEACAIRTEAARRTIAAVAGEAPTYALLLRLTAGDDASVVHIPHILCHLGKGASADDNSARRKAVAAHLAGTGATASPGAFDTVHVRWPIPAQPPVVSIIVPTRDKMKLLSTCVTGILNKTAYDNFELLIVDNGSTERDALAYLAKIADNPKVDVLRYNHPYNYSAINNFAVGHARGDYLCLLNNDTEVIDENWLTEMMRHAVRPHVGAVGAKLLYSDGSIQHAGVVVGLGEAAGHAHRFLRKGDPGYFSQAHASHYASAVTAACLVVEKKKFLGVGGLDEESLQIAFNDVDLCLKLERAGWRNVYASQAVMIHHESKSRGKDISPRHIGRYMRELAVLQTRWRTKGYADPMHHPSLDSSSETFIIRL